MTLPEQLTTSQVGDIGEEVVRALLEVEGAVIVALGDSGMPRENGRQDLDLVAIVAGELIAVEVKTRHASQAAGTLTRTGHLPRPRLSRSRVSGQSQGDRTYVLDRVRQFIDVDDDTELAVWVYVVDLRGALAQRHRLNGRRLAAAAELPVDVRPFIADAVDVLRSAGRLENA